MIQPEVTAVLGRRLLAFLIDGSLVAAMGLGIAFQQSTAFAVVGRDSDNKALVDPAEFESMKELLDFELIGRSEILGLPVVRAQEIGDSVRVFGADSYQTGLLAAAVAALILFGLVPALLQRTVGMLPLGIGVRKIDGTKAGIGAHIIRTIVGFIDAIPFVIPGALGFLTAKASSHRQRLGDRAAKTAVVDLKASLLGEMAGERIDLGLRPADDRDTGFAAAETAKRLNQPTFADQAETPRGPTPVEALANAEAAAGARRASDSVTIGAEATPASDEAPQAAKPAPKPTPGDQLPPPPVHRKAVAGHPLGTPSESGVATSPRHDVDADAEGDTSFDPASEVDAPTASSASHLLSRSPLDLSRTPLDLEPHSSDDLQVPDDAWQPPREEPAPVWQPTRLETAPVEAPNPHDGRTLDDVTRIEPSIGALLSGESDADESSTSARPGKHSQSEPAAKAPVWSDKWRAWMYWDTTKKCWLRHDTTSNTWQPID